MIKIFKLLVLVLVISLYSCENEPVDVTTISANDVINVDSDLFRTFVAILDEEPDNVTACIDFIYNFTVIEYDPNLEIVGFQVMHSDKEFILFLIALDDANSISLSYPITSKLANGEELVINNNDELQENLKTCLEEETIGYCNGILEDCIWKVGYLEGEDNKYEDAYFELSPMGNIWFHYNEDVYLGTWISLFIEDELHLNINLIDESEVAGDWNYDWIVTNLEPEQMNLFNGEKNIVLEKECVSPCKQLVFEECEFEPEGEVSRFNLSSYIECFLPFTDIVDLSNITTTFHEKIEDAEKDINHLEPTNYINIENPQAIYVRFEDDITGELYPILTLYITAITCNI